MSTELAGKDELTFLGDEAVDRLAQVCLELAAELWATRQRLTVLETALVDAGVTTPLDDHDLTEHRRGRPTARDEYVGRVLGALLGDREL